MLIKVWRLEIFISVNATSWLMKNRDLELRMKVPDNLHFTFIHDLVAAVEGTEAMAPNLFFEVGSHHSLTLIQVRRGIEQTFKFSYLRNDGEGFALDDASFTLTYRAYCLDTMRLERDSFTRIGESDLSPLAALVNGPGTYDGQLIVFMYHIIGEAEPNNDFRIIYAFNHSVLGSESAEERTRSGWEPMAGVPLALHFAYSNCVGLLDQSISHFYGARDTDHNILAEEAMTKIVGYCKLFQEKYKRAKERNEALHKAVTL
jgi:hypothetical protein